MKMFIASMNDTLYMHHHETLLVYAYLSREDRIAFERMDLQFWYVHFTRQTIFKNHMKMQCYNKHT